jgi:hypothetical protein
MIKRGFVLFILLFVCGTVHAQATRDSLTKDACLEKEIGDTTHLIFADAGRMKVGFLVENITWSDEYKRTASDVIQKQFSSNFVSAGDSTLGVLVLYISGTSAVANGAQYVSMRLQIHSGELLLPEEGNGILDLHTAKIADPVRSMSGELIFDEEGVLLPPLEQGMNFELWRASRTQMLREKIAKLLSDFVKDWQKADKK